MMLGLRPFFEDFFLDFGRVGEAFWPFLVGLEALWGDFFSFIFNEKFTTFCLQSLGRHLDRFWRHLGELGRLLEGLWEGFGSVLGRFWESLGEALGSFFSFGRGPDAFQVGNQFH